MEVRINRLVSGIIFLGLVWFVTGCAHTRIHLNPNVPVVKRTVPGYPKAIVVYDSLNDHTAGIAGVIAEGLKAPAVPVDQAGGFDMRDFDLVIIGSPVHGGRPTSKISDFLSSLPRPPMSAVFVTFGSALFSPMMTDACLDQMEKSLGGTCLGRFMCQDHHAIIFTHPGHPDEKDETDARRFAEGLLRRCRNKGADTAE